MKRMVTHVSGILLCFAMLLTLTVAVSAASCETHDFQNGFCSVCGSYQYAPLKNGYHEIRNAGQLYWFAAKVNKGETDLCAKLVADITVNGQVLAEDGSLADSVAGLRKWKPAGDADAPYVGTFDGNGKTISGLYLDDPKEDHAGLFGQIGPAGVVKGVTIADSWIRIWLEAKDEIYCGGITGENYGTIQDCHNGASISNNESYVGGIAGFNAPGASIIGCTNTGKLSGSYLVGGITAQSMGILKDCINYGPITAVNGRCGGITGSFGVPIGKGGGNQMTDCHNLGTVEASYYVGGVIGELVGQDAQVRGCSNTGAVTGKDHVGGIIGELWSGVKVYDSFNTGAVSGEKQVGGLAGHIERSSFIGCFNTGMITGGGGLFGWAQREQEHGEPINTPYVRCYYLVGTASCDVWMNEPQLAAFARSADFFRSGALAWALNDGVTDGSQAWYQDLGKDEMPGFSGGTVYRLTEPCGTFSNKAGTVQSKPHMSGSYVCTQGVYCTGCGDLLGHDYQSDVVAPTCQKQGYTAYVCEHCGHSYLGDYTDPEHQYEESFCIGCGKLEVPQILSCYSKEATSVKVTWSRVSAADRYQLYRLDTSDPDAGWKIVKTIKSNDITSYTNRGLTPGRTYRYKIRAHAELDDGEGIWSDYSQEEYMPGTVVFDAPYSNSSSRIRLRWKWVDGVDGYQIWRKDPGGTYRVVKTVNDGNATAYSNTGLTAGEKYTYKIRAFRITDDGKKLYGVFSEDVTVAVQPDAPGFTATSTRSGQVRLRWEQVNGATGYQIWISESPDSGAKITKTITSGDIVSYNKNGLEAGKTYYFKLRAFIEVDGKKTFGAYTTTVAVTVKN